jgi:hypothetical protein
VIFGCGVTVASRWECFREKCKRCPLHISHEMAKSLNNPARSHGSITSAARRCTCSSLAQTMKDNGKVRATVPWSIDPLHAEFCQLKRYVTPCLSTKLRRCKTNVRQNSPHYDWAQNSDSRSSRLYPTDRAPGTHCTEVEWA